MSNENEATNKLEDLTLSEAQSDNVKCGSVPRLPRFKIRATLRTRPMGGMTEEEERGE